MSSPGTIPTGMTAPTVGSGASRICTLIFPGVMGSVVELDLVGKKVVLDDILESSKFCGLDELDPNISFKEFSDVVASNSSVGFSLGLSLDFSAGFFVGSSTTTSIG